MTLVYNAAIRRDLLCVLFTRKWERSDRAKSAQSKTSDACLLSLLCTSCNALTIFALENGWQAIHAANRTVIFSAVALYLLNCLLRIGFVYWLTARTASTTIINSGAVRVCLTIFILLWDRVDRSIHLRILAATTYQQDSNPQK